MLMVDTVYCWLLIDVDNMMMAVSPGALFCWYIDMFYCIGTISCCVLIYVDGCYFLFLAVNRS